MSNSRLIGTAANQRIVFYKFDSQCALFPTIGICRRTKVTEPFRLRIVFFFLNFQVSVGLGRWLR